MDWIDKPLHASNHKNGEEVIKCNFFLKYPYIIQQPGNENSQIYWV